MENKLKHLEFIQNIITRMNSNSFMLKGWSVTLVSALYALAANDTNVQYVLISYVVIPVFWLVDGFYISQERQYRELYKQVAQKEENSIDFNLDASDFNQGRNSWLSGVFSKTLFPFYGISILATLIVMFILTQYQNG